MVVSTHRIDVWLAVDIREGPTRRHQSVEVLPDLVLLDILRQCLSIVVEKLPVRYLAWTLEKSASVQS